MSRRNQQSVQKVTALVRKIRFQRTLLGGVLALCLSLSVAFAQTVTGSITGEVTDPSGAVVPGAKVVAQNLDTGVESPTTTNTNGFYRIQFLPIGRYQVTVQAPGFNTETVPPFNLEVLQTPTFNVYSIGNTPWRGGHGDVLADISASCRKFGLKLGVYVSPRDASLGADVGGICKTTAQQQK